MSLMFFNIYMAWMIISRTQESWVGKPKAIACSRTYQLQVLVYTVCVDTNCLLKCLLLRAVSLSTNIQSMRPTSSAFISRSESYFIGLTKLVRLLNSNELAGRDKAIAYYANSLQTFSTYSQSAVLCTSRIAST